MRNTIPAGRLTALLMLVVLLAAACGSSHKNRLVGSSGSGGPNDTGAPGTSAVPGASGAPGTSASGAPGSSSGSVAGTPGSSVSVVKGPGGKVYKAIGPGITATTIYVGTVYTKNQGAANAAIGAGGLDQGDARKPIQVVIDEINKHGGLFGRKVVQVAHGYDANSTQSSDQQDQEACADWTKDHKVFALFSSGDIINECAKKAGVFQLGGGRSFPETYKQYPHRIDIDSLNMIRLGSVTIDGLAGHGYFDKGARIGLVTWDDPVYHSAVTRGYMPPLKAHGLSLAAPVQYIHSPATVPEVSQSSADIGAAVLKFQSQNIDHVMILDGQSGQCGGNCLTLEWFQQANSQRYYPRLGLNDTSSAKALYDMGLMPKQSAHRMVQVTWIDADNSYDAGWHPNKPREECYALMRKHGIDMSNANAQGAALGACTELWFFQLAVNRVSGTLTADSLVSGVDTLGYSYTSPAAYGNFFNADRHDGLGSVRILVFDDSCSCFEYKTTPYRV